MTANKKTDDFIIRDKSDGLSYDLQYISKHRHNPFVKNGKVDADAYIEFVTDYNEFINHQPKPFTKIIDTNMVL